MDDLLDAACYGCAMKRLALILFLAAAIWPEPANTDFNDGLAAYNNGDYETAYREWLTSAENGNPVAQFSIGTLYDRGHGIGQDHKEAVKWVRKAAEQGYARAQITLGVYYKKGKGVPRDPAKAVKWYRKAADQGDTMAIFYLGLSYEYDQGVPEGMSDFTKLFKAMKFFHEAAQKGQVESINHLGLVNEQGIIVRRNPVEAWAWYHLAAEQGHPSAAIFRDVLSYELTDEQIALAKKWADDWRNELGLKPVKESIPLKPLERLRRKKKP